MVKRVSTEAVALCLLLGALGAAAVTDPIVPNTALPLASLACLSTKSVNVAFVVDRYNSNFQEVRDFMNDFAYGFLKRNTTRIGVAQESGTVLSLSDDVTTVQNAVNGITGTGGSTDPLNGITAAIKLLQNDTSRLAYPNQLQASYLVLIRHLYSGLQDASVTALRQAQAYGIEVFVVVRNPNSGYIYPAQSWAERAASTPAGDHIFKAAAGYSDLNGPAGGVATQLLGRIIRANSVAARGDNVGLGVCSLVGGSHVHIQSFDGHMFSFNGWGEYTLLQTRGPVSGWTVQARVMPCSQGSSQTCVRGLIAQDDSNHYFQVLWQPRPNGAVPEVWINGDSAADFNLDHSNYNSNGVAYWIVAIGNTVEEHPGYMIDAIFPLGGHIRLIIRDGFQAISVRAPAALTSYTRGLCGVSDQCLSNEQTTSADVVTGDLHQFSESWRVNAAQSLFAALASETYTTYDFRNWANAPAADADRSECDAVAASPLLRAACRADSATVSLGFYTDVTRMLCSDWLYYGKEYTSLLADPAGSCGTYGNPEPHNQDYLHNLYNITLPEYFLQDDAQPTAFMRPGQNLGGTYGFKVTAEDVCQTITKYVNLNVKCSGTSAAPSLARYGPARLVEVDRTRNVNYFPYVQLQADLLGGGNSGSPLFYSWAMTHFPPGTDTEIVRGQQTLVPVVYVSPYDPPESEYWFEVAVSDGCAIHRDTVVIRTRCSKCAPTARIDGNDALTLNASTSFENNRQYNPVALNIVARDADLSNLNYKYSLYKLSNSSFHWAVSNVTSGSTTTYDIYEVTVPRADLGNITMSESSSTPVTPGGTSSAPVVLTHFGGYTSPVNGATRYTTTSTWSTSHDAAVTGVIQLEQRDSKCSIDVYASNDYAQVTATEVNSDPWATPLCVGTYQMKVDAMDDCRTATDIAELGVECGGMLSARLQCPTTVAYNYGASSFPVVNIDGSQTFDSHNRDLQSLWTLTVPADSGLNSGDLVSNGPFGRQLNLDQGGTYTVRLDVTNGCQQDYTTATVVGTCGNPVTAAATSTPSGTVTFPAQGNTVNLDGTTSNSNNIGASLSYAWSVTAPAALYTTVLPSDVASFEPSPMNAFGGTFTATMRFGGTYVYNLRVTDGCTTARTTVNVNYACTNTITLAPNINGGAATLTQTYDYGTGFQTVTLAANPTYGGTTAQYRFMLTSWPGGSSATPSVTGFSASSSVTFTPDRFGEYTFRLDAQDGCTWSSDVSLKLTVTMPTLTARIERDAARALMVGTAQYFSGILSSSTSTTQPSLTYSWSVIQQPGSSAFFSSPNSMNSTFFDSGSGLYTIRLYVTDSLFYGAFAYADYSFTLLCPSNPYTAGITTSTNSVAWSSAHGAFPLVELTGKTSNLNSLPNSYYTYEWRITAAPVNSVYAPTDVITVSNSSSVNTFNSVNSLWQNHTIVISNSSSYTETVSWVELTGTVQTPDFAAVCFRPDVAGTYTLQFRFRDDCLPFTAAQVATITATCNSAPTITKITPLQRKSLSFSTFERVSVSVTATDSNEDTLWYEWSWVSHPSNLTEGNFITIADARGPEASFVPQKPGNYTLKVTVSDGCSKTEGFVTVITSCDSDASREAVQNVNVAYDPFSQGPLTTTTFTLTDDNERECTLSYNWELIEFTPDTLPFSAITAEDTTLSGGEIAGIVIGVVAFVVVVAIVAIICYRRRKAKGESGGTEMGAR